MSGVTDYGAAIITSVAAALSVLFAFIPRLIGALLLILIGWIVAGIVYRVLVAVLRRLRVDEVAERTGITAFLARGNVQTDAAGLIGDLAQWFIAFFGVLAFFVVAAVGQIGVATGILNMLFTAVVGGLSLALARAFGLGGRDAAGRAIESASGAFTGPTTDTTTVRVVTPRGDPRPPADRGRQPQRFPLQATTRDGCVCVRPAERAADVCTFAGLIRMCHAAASTASSRGENACHCADVHRTVRAERGTSKILCCARLASSNIVRHPEPHTHTVASAVGARRDDRALWECALTNAGSA